MPDTDFPEHECLFTLVSFGARYCLICTRLHPEDDPTGTERRGTDRDDELQYRGAV